MKATVGRIVHFYDPTLKEAERHPTDGFDLNGAGAGPYAAMVLQASDTTSHVNLVVHAYAGDWRAFDVAESGEEADGHCYWTWPPIVAEPSAPEKTATA